MSCSLSGVMSTGTSNGEPSSCPPSSWNCTSSRCTSRAAASSCANTRSGRQPRAGEGRVPAPAARPPRGPRAPAPRRAPPPPSTHTHRHGRRHPASPRGGERRGRDGAPPRERVVPQLATSPSGVAEGKCRAAPARPGTHDLPWTVRKAHLSPEQGYFLAPLYRWGNRGSERLIFPKVTEKENDRRLNRLQAASSPVGDDLQSQRLLR